MYRIKLKKSALKKKAVITVGCFDGLHLGHMKILKTLQHIAKNNNNYSMVMTFEPSPHEYFARKFQKETKARLSLLRDKYFILKKLGYIDELIILHFNSSIATLSADDFIEKILKKSLDVEHVVMGHDFKFGKNGAGNQDTFNNQNIATTVVAPCCLNGEIVSSSLIRKYASKNDLVNIKHFLGHNLHYTSRIIYGNQIGRKFGVPTINLSLRNNLPALSGIYVALVHIENKIYKAVASIGKNPSITNSDNYKLEAHLLGVDLNLYGKIASIELLHFIRQEAKFITLELLFKQIYLDIEYAYKYFSNSANSNIYNLKN